MSRVCAFVLTRNRKQLLTECIGALLGQTHPVDSILILDNASTDGTEQELRDRGLLDEPAVSFVRSDDNTGGAGGYARGVELALERDSDWLWLMDDDAEPRADALERLLTAPAAGDSSTAVLCSAVVDPRGDLELMHRSSVGRFMKPLSADLYRDGRHPSIGGASFVGFMVRTDVARAVGLPRAEFFIGCDDIDYSVRVRHHGTIRLVPESVIVHKLGMGGGSVTRRSRFWNRVLGVDYTSNSWEGYWKNLHAMRNFIWIRHHYGRPSRPAFVAMVGAYIVKSLLYDPQPLRRIPWIVRYALRGRRGDFSGHSPEDWASVVTGRPD